MAYTANIPQASDDPSQSQALLLANFQEISTAFNTNHGDFNSGDQGLHKFLQMPEQSSAPATGTNEGALYTKDVSGTTQLFWREETNGTEYQMTGQQTLSGGQGSFTLPGGLIIKYGATVTSAGSFNYTTPFPTAVYAVTMTFNNQASSGTCSVSSSTVNGFIPAMFGGVAGQAVNFMAIGT